MNTENIMIGLMVVTFIGMAPLIPFFGIRRIQQIIRKSGSLRGSIQQIRQRTMYSELMPAWKTGKAILMQAMLLLLGLGLLSAAWFVCQRSVRDAKLLLDEGITTTARVADKHFYSSESRNTYYILYTFVPAGNSQRTDVRCKVEVPEDVYDRLEYGGSAEVIYARSAPNVTQIYELYTPGKVIYWPVILLGGTGLLCMALSWLPFRKYREARFLDEVGVTATTHLLARFEDSNDGGMSYYIAYHLPGIGPIRHTVAYRIFKRVSIGDGITVIYLPDNSRVFRPCWR